MKVLILSPHPDDDVIGCGGAIRQHIHHEDELHTVYVTSGGLGIPDTEHDVAAHIREVEAGIAAQVLHSGEHLFWYYKDGSVMSVKDELAADLKALLQTEHYDLVYCPHKDESHSDHRAVALALEHAYFMTFPTAEDFPATRWYSVWTPLQSPNLFIDITREAQDKRGAIRAHKSQLSNSFDEAILALNRYYALMHATGYFAEAFFEVYKP